MTPVELILGALLFASGGSNWLQFKKINNKAEELHKVNKELQVQKDELKNKDEKLIEAEIKSRKREERFEDEIAHQGFIIHSQAIQLKDDNPDSKHQIHARTTEGFNKTMGDPLVLPLEGAEWNTKYLSKAEQELAVAKVEKEESSKAVEELRAQLRTLQAKHELTLEELDFKSTDLLSVTKEKAGIMTQFNEWIRWCIIGGIIFGIITAFGYIKGFLNSIKAKKYHQAFEEFAIENDEGNEIAAKILQKKNLYIPSVLRRALQHHK